MLPIKVLESSITISSGDDEIIIISDEESRDSDVILMGIEDSPFDDSNQIEKIQLKDAPLTVENGPGDLALDEVLNVTKSTPNAENTGIGSITELDKSKKKLEAPGKNSALGVQEDQKVENGPGDLVLNEALNVTKFTQVAEDEGIGSLTELDKSEKTVDAFEKNSPLGLEGVQKVENGPGDLVLNEALNVTKCAQVAEDEGIGSITELDKSEKKLEAAGNNSALGVQEDQKVAEDEGIIKKGDYSDNLPLEDQKGQVSTKKRSISRGESKGIKKRRHAFD